MCFEHQKVCDFEKVAEHSVKRKFSEEDENDGLPKKQGTRVVHSASLQTENDRKLCDNIEDSEDPCPLTSLIEGGSLILSVVCTKPRSNQDEVFLRASNCYLPSDTTQRHLKSSGSLR